MATRAQWPRPTSSTQAHAQTEPRHLRRFIQDVRYAGVIPPWASGTRELMVPSKRCLPTQPPELVLIGCRGLEAGRGLIWEGNHFPKREAGSHPVPLCGLSRVPAAVAAETSWQRVGRRALGSRRTCDPPPSQRHGPLRQPRARRARRERSCQLPEVAPPGSDPGFAWVTGRGSGSVLQNN